jgi:hypothetical protein
MAERPPRPRPEVGGSPFEAAIEALQPGSDDQDDERDREDQVAGHHRVQAELEVERLAEEDQESDADQEPGDHDRQGEAEAEQAGGADAAADERKSDHGADDRGNDGHGDRDLDRGEQGLLDRCVGREHLVPVQGQPGDRQARRRRLLEREEDQERDGQVEESQHCPGQDHQGPASLPGEPADRHGLERAGPPSHW